MDFGTQFKNLHQPGNPFILANAWDAGSAKMLKSMGAKAIGTSSAAHAFTLGRVDGGLVTRDEALAHAQDLISATNLPVSGDFENGFGDTPEICAETVRLSAEIGLAGICIEDEDFGSNSAYNFDLAVERVRAAAAATQALPKDFVFAARADGVMNGHYDLDEAIRRIQAFDAAGADCLYIPTPGNAEDLRRVVKSTSKPVNALAVGPLSRLKITDFAKNGVARISLGSALARYTIASIKTAGTALFEDGDFSNMSQGIAFSDLNQMLT